MARKPRSTNGELSTELVKIYLTLTEKQKAQNLAGTLTLSEHFRRSGLKQRRSSPVPEVNRLLYLELGQIGSNLNQIARACNLTVQQGRHIRIDMSEFRQLQQTLDQIRWQLLNPEVPEVPDDDEDVA